MRYLPSSACKCWRISWIPEERCEISRDKTDHAPPPLFRFSIRQAARSLHSKSLTPS